jgi:hypothetical protein
MDHGLSRRHPPDLPSEDPVTCINPLHDHTTTTLGGESFESAERVPMVCNHCGTLIHWDEVIGAYQHDDDAAKPCGLIPERYTGATECFTFPPRVTTLGGLPRILLDHRILVMMLPGFGDPNTLMEYENGYAQVRMPERSPS